MKKRKLFKYGTYVTVSGLVLAGVLMMNGVGKVDASNYNYSQALKYGVQFYDANKCGKDAGEDNVFDWRGACHVNDGTDVGLDLSGGYHDCGDHVKFGITQGYSASVLGWSLYEYKDAFTDQETKKKMLDTLKHFTDYFLKCHPNDTVFYYQLGDGGEDHAYWGAPEDQGDRKTIFKADANDPASDVCGETSAALSLMYLNYKDIDETYANKCLSAAKSIYKLGKSNLGLSQAQGYYNSSSYKDDLAWAATWLYKITGEESYLEEAKENMKGTSGCVQDEWTMCWDDMNAPATIQLYKLTNDKIYLEALTHNVDYWKTGIKTTPGGLKYLDTWGVLRYSASASMIALQYYGLTGDQEAKNLAVNQINYILGDNPNNMSYMIGYGDNYPTHPHHRAANGYTYANGDNLKPAKHVLVGALVGGPDANDQYCDAGDQYVYTEVGIDYNAGLVGALAGLISETGGGDTTTSPTATANPTVTPTTTVSPTTIVTSTPSPTGEPVKGVIPKVEVTTKVSESVSQRYKIVSAGTSDVELSNLSIRYYFTKQGTKKDTFYCDCAGLQLNESPWYVELAKEVKGTVKDGYLEIIFDTNQILKTDGGSLAIDVRLAQENWEKYSDFKEVKTEVYYNGSLVE